MRAVSGSLLTGTAFLVSLLSAIPLAHAQFFYEGPHKPEVEIDLSVLGDPTQAPTPPQSFQPQTYQQQTFVSPSGFMPPITATVPTASVESAPLPPIPSPYENRRVVGRIELEGSNPYLSKQAPSPFNPAAIVKPPKAPDETPRTVPAALIKPQPPSALEGGAPIVVEAESELMQKDGIEMPAVNVTSDIRDIAPRTAPIATHKKTVSVLKPARKPTVLSLAPEQETSRTVDTSNSAQALPVVSRVVPAAVTAAVSTPEVKKSAEKVIDDLYTLPSRETAKTAPEPPVDLAALSLDAPIPLPDDSAPPLLISPVQSVSDNTADSIFFTATNVALDDEMHHVIDRIAALLDDSNDTRLLVKGYASGADGNRAAARRLSVSRALAVRAYLMDKGIKPSRVDVRGMGSDNIDTKTPLDRVDLVLIR